MLIFKECWLFLISWILQHKRFLFCQLNERLWLYSYAGRGDLKFVDYP